MLNFLALSLQCLDNCTFYVSLPQYLFPFLVTGENLRPDMLISTLSNTRYVLELSVGFETNLDNNGHRNFTKYRYLLHDLTSNYCYVQFVNLSIGSLGIFGQSCDLLIQMCCDLTIDKAHTNYQGQRAQNFKCYDIYENQLGHLNPHSFSCGVKNGRMKALSYFLNKQNSCNAFVKPQLSAQRSKQAAFHL